MMEAQKAYSRHSAHSLSSVSTTSSSSFFTKRGANITSSSAAAFSSSTKGEGETTSITSSGSITTKPVCFPYHDTNSCNMVLTELGKRRRFDLAYSFLQLMNELDLKADGVSYNILMDLALKVRWVEVASLYPSIFLLIRSIPPYLPIYQPFYLPFYRSNGLRKSVRSWRRCKIEE